MTNLTPIIHRAERCKSQYPKPRFILAHRGLIGDEKADAELRRTTSVLPRPRRSVFQKLRAALKEWGRG